MKRKWLALILISIINALILSGCVEEPPKPEGVISSSELLADPVYNTPLEVYGQVHGLGEFECKCFALKSEGKQIYVWFDMMVDEDGRSRSPIKIVIY